MTVKEDSFEKQDKERKSKKDEEKFLKKLNRQKGDNVQFELDFDTGTWNKTPKTLTLKDPLDPGFIYQKSSIFLVDKDGKETDVTKSGELIYEQATHTVTWTIKATEEEPEKVNEWYNQKLIWRMDVQVKPDLELGNKHSLLLKNQGILLIDEDEYPTNPVTVEVTEEPPAPEPEEPKETEGFLPKAGTQILASLPYLGGGILVAALALLNRKKIQQLFQKIMNRK